MVAIRNQSSSGENRVMDVGLVLCASLVLLVGIVVLDAYEYVRVPGASHARNKIHIGVEQFAGMEIMSKDEHEQLKKEIEAAKALVEKKHDELEAIVSRMEEEEKKKKGLEEELEAHKKMASTAAATTVSDSKKTEPPSVTVTVKNGNKSEKTPQTTVESKKEEEEKKENIIEPLLQKELGIDKFCGECKWKSMGFNCDARVQYLVGTYHITEDVAKESVLKDCTRPEKRMRALRGSIQSTSIGLDVVAM